MIALRTLVIGFCVEGVFFLAENRTGRNVLWARFISLYLLMLYIFLYEKTDR